VRSALRSRLEANRVFTYSGELTGVPASAAPNILDKSYTITAAVEIPEGGAEGMIVNQGGRFGGYCLFLSKGEFGFDPNAARRSCVKGECTSTGAS
jgi:hypothetical protein